MKRLFFISFLVGITLGFSSCNIGEGGNYVTTEPAPAVVDFRSDMGGTIIRSLFGYYAAPSLSPLEYFEGDCIFTQFTIDYDNQPSEKYYTASNISPNRVDKDYLRTESQSTLDGYTLPISSLIAIYSSPNYAGKLFIQADTKKEKSSFRLVRDPSDEDQDGVIDLYLQAKLPSTSGTIDSKPTVYAFDLRNFILNQNNDTTITYSDGKVDYKYIKVCLHYQVSETEVPKYEKANSGKPFDILIFKDEL